MKISFGKKKKITNKAKQKEPQKTTTTTTQNQTARILQTWNLNWEFQPEVEKQG